MIGKRSTNLCEACVARCRTQSKAFIYSGLEVSDLFWSQVSDLFLMLIFNCIWPFTVTSISLFKIMAGFILLFKIMSSLISLFTMIAHQLKRCKVIKKGPLYLVSFEAPLHLSIA